jgi:integron integrase
VGEARPRFGSALRGRFRRAIRLRHLSPRTEKAYWGWIVRYVLFHGKRHPVELGAREISRFLSFLATERAVSASTQNQALSALLFLYRDVLGQKIEGLDGLIRARRPRSLPVVLSVRQVSLLLEQLHGAPRLMATLLYGAGLRLIECASLRVKDVDFDRRQITVRFGKGGKDRVTVLPESVCKELARHLERVRSQHARDLADGAGHVELPYALARKYPSASREWPWQWVFPATRIYTHLPTGERRRHHLHETVLQRAVRAAVRSAELPKQAGCHTLRQYADFRIMPRRIERCA